MNDQERAELELGFIYNKYKEKIREWL